MHGFDKWDESTLVENLFPISGLVVYTSNELQTTRKQALGSIIKFVRGTKPVFYALEEITGLWAPYVCDDAVEGCVRYLACMNLGSTEHKFSDEYLSSRDGFRVAADVRQTLIGWIEKIKSKKQPETAGKLPVKAVVAVGASDDVKAATNWRMQIQAEAYEYWLRLRASGCNPSVHSICENMAEWCIDKDIKGGKGQNPRAGTIRNTVLGAGHWNPPPHSVEQAKKYIAQIARTAQTQDAQTKK